MPYFLLFLYNKKKTISNSQAFIVLFKGFFVFSDDIHWTKETLQINGAEFVDWNKAENSYWDMFLMSKCKHNIIANSSFSWWAAWLNNNKIKLVLTPQNWMPHFFGTRDLIPKTWIKIKNEF